MIYEQLLHAPDADAEESEKAPTPGRKAGAYYTPLPVVNLCRAWKSATRLRKA